MWFTAIACFATIPPLAGIYGDGVVYNCTKSIYPWVFCALNAGTAICGAFNMALFCKYKKRF